MHCSDLLLIIGAWLIGGPFLGIPAIALYLWLGTRPYCV